MFKMQSLRRLHKHLDENGMSKVLFDYDIREVRFKAFYTIDVLPHELSLTPQGLKPDEAFFLLWSFDKDFCADPNIGKESFYKLARLLKHDGSSGNRLNPAKFLSELDQHCKNVAFPKNAPNPQQIAKARLDMEEREKPFFCTWRMNGKRLGRQCNVSQKNLWKTATMLGRAARDFSERKNASSVWTDDATRARNWDKQ
jgi:hypothetical protein